MTKKKHYKPGDRVYFSTVSGVQLVGTVIEDDGKGRFLLESPDFGYAVSRHWSELELVRRKAKAKP